MTAVECLGEIGDPHTFSALRAVAEGVERELAASATDALGGIRTDECFRYLTQCPLDRAFASYRALGYQCNPRAFEFLIMHLKSSGNDEAMVLADTLLQLGDTRAIPHLMKRAQQPGDNITYGIFPAVAGLSSAGVKIVAEFLHSTNHESRWSALFVLGESQKKEALPYLRPLLKHPEASVRQEAITAMASIFYAHKMTGP